MLLSAGVGVDLTERVVMLYDLGGSTDLAAELGDVLTCTVLKTVLSMRGLVESPTGGWRSLLAASAPLNKHVHGEYVELALGVAFEVNSDLFLVMGQILDVVRVDLEACVVRSPRNLLLVIEALLVLV